MRLRSSVGSSSSPSPNPAPTADRKIGTVLADEGFIAPGDIDSILAQQATSGALYGETAVNMGKVSAEELNYALAKQVDSGVLARGDDSIDPLLVSAFNLNDPYVAQVRAIRSKIVSIAPPTGSLDHRACAIIGFDCPEETAVLAGNLAIVMARMGTPTAVVDAGYDAPLLDGLFRLPNRAGLSTLRGEARATEVAQASAIANLSIITSGPAPASTATALEREPIMEKLANWDYPQTQFVITLSVKDGGIIGPTAQALVGVNSAVLLARKHQTEIHDLRQMIDLLDERDIAIAGVVIV